MAGRGRGPARRSRRTATVVGVTHSASILLWSSKLMPQARYSGVPFRPGTRRGPAARPDADALPFLPVPHLVPHLPLRSPSRPHRPPTLLHSLTPIRLP